MIAPEAMPYPNAVGMIYDSGTYEANLDLSMRIPIGTGFAERQREARRAGSCWGSASPITSSRRSARRRNAPTSP